MGSMKMIDMMEELFNGDTQQVVAQQVVEDEPVIDDEALMEDDMISSTMDYEVLDTPDQEPASEPEQAETVAFNQAVLPPEVKPYTKGGMRYQLVFEGICTHCAHCGQPLTDSESVERGLGPVCSKKGYLEEVEPKDDAEAMLALAEYPELVNYLITKYKPKGNRGLVNGLTRTASLNRRSPVHAACTDAIEALGYKRLASALRESISAVELYELPDNQDAYGMWIKKADFSWSFWNRLKYEDGVHMTRYPKRATIVPKKHRVFLAKLLVEFYQGLYIKTPKGSFKITQEWFDRMSK